jgi:hypothetical protein
MRRGVSSDVLLPGQKSLKGLKFSMASVKSNFIRYIILYAPISLDTVHFDLNYMGFYDWVDQVGLDNALKLADRLSKSNNACINFPIGANPQPANNITLSKMDQFFTLLVSMKGQRKLYLDATFSDYHHLSFTVSHYPGTITLKVSESKSLAFNYIIDQRDFAAADGDDDGAGNADNKLPANFQSFLPTSDNKSIIGPENLNCLNIDVGHPTENMAYNLLEYASLNCPHLQYFEFYCCAEENEHKSIAAPLDNQVLSERANPSITTQ